MNATPLRRRTAYTPLDSSHRLPRDRPPQRPWWAFAAAALVLVFAAGSLRAATIAWDGGGDGTTFSDAANWAGDAVPGAGDHAVIALAGTYTIALTSDVSLKGLDVGGTSGTQTLDASGYHLVLGTDSSCVGVNGLLAIGGLTDPAGFALAIDGPLDVFGRLDWSNGTINANTYYLPPAGRVVTIAPGGTMRWLGNGPRYLSATLDNRGTLRWEAGTSYFYQGYAHTTSGTFDIALDADATFARTGINSQGPWVLTNTGTIRKRGPGRAVLQVELRNVGASVVVEDGTLVQNYRARWERTSVAVAAGDSLWLHSNYVSEPQTVADTLSGTIDGTFLVSSLVNENGTSLEADRTTGGVVNIGGTGLQVNLANLGGVYDSPTATYSPSPVNVGLMRLVGGLTKSIDGPFVNEGTVRWESGTFVYSVTASFANHGLLELAPDTDQLFRTGGINGGRPGPLVSTGVIRKSGSARADSKVDITIAGGMVDVRDGALVQEAKTRWEDATVAVAPGGTLWIGGYFIEHEIAGPLRGSLAGTFLFSGLTYGYYTRLVADSVRGGRLALGGTGLQLADNELGTPVRAAPVNDSLLRFVGADYQLISNNFRNEGTVRWERGDLRMTPGLTLTNTGVFEVAANGRSFFGSGFSGVAVIDNDTAGIMRKVDTGRATISASVKNHGRLAVAAGTLIVDNAFNSANDFTSSTSGIIAGVGTLDMRALPAAHLHNDGITAPGPSDDGDGIGTLTVIGPLPHTRVVVELAGRDSVLYDRLVAAGAIADVAGVTIAASLAGAYTPARGDFFDVIEASVINRVLDVVETPSSLRLIDTYPGIGVRLVLDTAAAENPVIDVIAPTLAARQGEAVDLPITIVATPGARSAGATSVTLRLAFNATMLGPVGTSPRGTITPPLRTIPFTIPISSSSDTTVAHYRFTATLGNDSVTVLDVDSAASDGVGVRVVEHDGSFTLLDLCRAGGARLVNPDGVVTMSRIRPNPVTNAITFDVDLIEQGVTRIMLCDINGTIVRTFVDGPLPRGRHTIELDARRIPSGRYFLVVATPTIRMTEPVEVVR